MRLLAVSYNLPPMLYPQAIQIGRLLAWLPVEIAAVSGSVEVLATGLDSYEDFDRKLAFNLKVPNRTKLPRLAQSLALHLVPFYGRSPDLFRGWVKQAEAALVEKLDSSGYRPDALITFGEPMSDHLLGLRLKQRFGLPWIAHFSDPWADNPFRRHEVMSNILNRRDERQVVELADRVIFTSVETLDLVMGKYPPAWRGKASVLGHSFDPALYPPRSGGGDHLIVRYLGNFYGHRSPLPLFKALRLILDAQPRALDGVVFELVGSLPKRMLLHSAFKSLPEGLVRLVGTVPYSQSMKLMSSADLLLVIDGPDDLSVFLPSKLIDYVGAGVPIFGIVPLGTSACLLTRLGGAIADPRAPSEVATELLKALAEVRARKSEPRELPWGAPEVRSEFHIDSVVKAFSALLTELQPR